MARNALHSPSPMQSPGLSFHFHTPSMIQLPVRFVPRATFLYPACLASPSTPAGSKGKDEMVKNIEVDLGDNEIEKDMLEIDVRDAFKNHIILFFLLFN